MRTAAISLSLALSMTLSLAIAVAQPPAQAHEPRPPRRILVPFEDLDAVLAGAARDPWGFVLLPTATVQELMQAARRFDEARGTAPLPAQAAVVAASYALDVTPEAATLSAQIDLISQRDGWIAIPLQIGAPPDGKKRAAAGYGVLSARLDDAPAALGRDDAGRLVLFNEKAGRHRLQLDLSVSVAQIPTGLSLYVPLVAAPLADLAVTAPGDVTLRASAPLSDVKYDAASQTTTARLSPGAVDHIDLAIEGNGRRTADHALLLGETLSSVHLSTGRAAWAARISVEILRRSERELTLAVPDGWLLTSVAHPDLQSWRLGEPDAQGMRDLLVRFRRPVTARQTLELAAEQAVTLPARWSYPRAFVRGAAESIGVWRFEPGRGVQLRGESLRMTRRIDDGGDRPGAYVLYAWGTQPAAELQLEPESPRSVVEQGQRWQISDDGATLEATIRLTCRQGELFNLELLAPSDWEIQHVRSNRPESDFRWRAERAPAGQRIRTEWTTRLAAGQHIEITLQARFQPPGWSEWLAALATQGAPRLVSLTTLEIPGPHEESGVIGVFTRDDLSALPVAFEGLRPIPPQELGAAPDERVAPPHGLGFSYRGPAGTARPLRLQLSRRSPIVTARAVNFAVPENESTHLAAQIDYRISAARVRDLYLRLPADAAPSTQFDAYTESGARLPIVDRQQIEWSDAAPQASRPAAGGTLWRVRLDSPAIGVVSLAVGADVPRPAGDAAHVPLVWPERVDSFSALVAVLGKDEVELTFEPGPELTEAQVIDVPALRVRPAGRLVAVYQFSQPTTLAVRSVSHATAAVPAAVIDDASYQSVVDADGTCRTRAVLRVKNAGAQFLQVTLHEHATLWSLIVDGAPAKPRQSASGAMLLVALPLRPDGVDVEFVYEQRVAPLGRSGWFRLSPPRYAGPGGSVPTNRTTWQVFPPPGYVRVDANGDLSPLGAASEPLAYQQWIRGTVAALETFDRMRWLPSLSRARDRNWIAGVEAESGSAARAARDFSAVESQLAQDIGQQPPRMRRAPAGRPVGGFAGGGGGRPDAGADGLVDGAVRDDLAAGIPSVAAGESPPQEGALQLALRNAEAEEVATTIEQRFASQRGDGAVLHVRPDPAANTLYFSGTPEQLAAARQLVEQLDAPDQSESATPAPADGQTLANDGLPVSSPQQRLVSELTRGRSSLPIDLQGCQGITLQFAGLGQDPAVELRLVQQAHRRAVTAALVAAIALTALRLTSASRAARTRFVLTVLILASVVPLLAGRATVAHANAAFHAGVGALAWFSFAGIVRAAARRLRSRWNRRVPPVPSPGGPGPGPALTAALILALLFSTAADARAAGAPAAPDPRGKAAPPPAPPPPPLFPPDALIVPYDPVAGVPSADRALLSYERFVELWNKAHPDRRILVPEFLPARFAFTQADYHLTIPPPAAAGASAACGSLSATARIGVVNMVSGWTRIPLPFKNVMIKSASVLRPVQPGGQPTSEPAVLTPTPNGYDLLAAAPGPFTLLIEFDAQATLSGPRGEAELTVPPVAAASVETLPPPFVTADLLDAPGGQRRRSTADGREVVIAALRADGRVRLRWLPKPDASFRDDTMTAEVNASYAVMDEVLRLSGDAVWSLPLARSDRFVLAFDPGVTVLRIDGPDVHEWTSAAGPDGRSLVTIRLHRPAERRWSVRFDAVAPLPAGAAPGGFQVLAPGAARDAPQPFALPQVHASGVQRESGHVVIAAAQCWTVRVSGTAGLTQIDLPEERAAPTQTAVLGAAAYRYGSLPIALSVAVARAPLQLEAQCDTLLRLAEDRSQTFFRALVDARRGRTHDLRFVVPAGIDVLTVAGPAVAAHWLEDPTPAPATAADTRVLHVALAAGLTGRTSVVVVAVAPLAARTALTVQPIWLMDAHRQRGRVALQAVAPLEVTVDDAAGMAPVPPDLLSADWLTPAESSTVTHAFRWENEPAALQARLTRNTPRTRAETIVGVAVSAETLRHVVRLRYDVDRAAQDRFSFELPNWPPSEVRILAGNLRSVADAPLPADPRRRRWTVELQSPVLGAVELVAVHERPLRAGQPVHVARAEPIGVEVTRWTVLLQAEPEIELTEASRRGLDKLAAAAVDLPIPNEVLQGVTAAYRAYGPDHELSFNLLRRSELQLDRAVVTALELESTVGLSGALRGRATLHVENRTEQYLRLTLPPAADLWSVTVAGAGVRPAKAANGDLLIPLVKTSAAETSYPVVLDFQLNGGRRVPAAGWLDLPAPLVRNLPVQRTTWRVHLPDELSAYWDAGNVSRVEAVELAIESLERSQSEAQRLYQISSSKSKYRSLAWGNLNRLNRSNSAILEQIASEVASAEQRGEGERFKEARGKLDAQRTLQGRLLQQAEAVGKEIQAGSPVSDGRGVGALEQGTLACGGPAGGGEALAALPEFCASMSASAPPDSAEKRPAAPQPVTKAQAQISQQLKELNERTRAAQMLADKDLERLEPAGRGELAKKTTVIVDGKPPSQFGYSYTPLDELRDAVAGNAPATGELRQRVLLQTQAPQAPQAAQAADAADHLSRPDAALPEPHAPLPAAATVAALTLPVAMPRTDNIYAFSKTLGDPRLRLLLVHRDARESTARTAGLLLIIAAGALIARAVRTPTFLDLLVRHWPLLLLALALAAALAGLNAVAVVAALVSLIGVLLHRLRRRRATVAPE